MNKQYFEEFRIRVTTDRPYAVFPRENINYAGHIHEEIEVVYVLSGQVTATAERGEEILRGGDMCVFMQDEIHALHSLTANRVYVIRILPHQSLPLDFSMIRLDRNWLRPGEPGYRAMREAVLGMAREDKERRFCYELAQDKWVRQILLTIAREMAYSEIRPEERKKLTGRSYLLRTVNNYIEGHYTEQISLEQIAEKCNCSKYYFAHMLKDLTGMSFVEFLTLYRLNRAAEELRSSGGCITDIALANGFTNLRAFNRMFQKYYRTTPSLYRKNRPG